MTSGTWRDPATGKRKGSTAYWRKLRLATVRQHGYVCCLCGQAIDPRLPNPHPRSLSIHHMLGSQAGLYDSRFLRPAHRVCNFKAGDPARVDPPARIMTNW